jgi:dTDP-4-dehydrorhamnose reductase
MLRLGREREQLGVVADQYGGPTFAGDIANALVQIASQLETARLEGKAETLPWGVYHYGGLPHVSWHQFAQTIFDEAKKQQLLPSPALKAITTAEYPTPAKRPTNSRLDCSKIEHLLGIQPSNWPQALQRIQDYGQA